MIAVLGPGGVGGMLAVRTGAACVGSARTVAVIRERGLTLVHGGTSTVAHPVAAERLEHPVSLLVVAVKAPDLDDALARIDPVLVEGGVVLPLLNGLEHVARLRARFAGNGATVVAGSIGRYQGHVAEPGTVVQSTTGALVRAASDTLPADDLGRALASLQVSGVEVVVGGSEAEVLWEKAARLAVLAAATTAARASVGVLRSDPAWRARVQAGLAEACAAATAHGVPLDAADQWAVVESMAPGLTTSTARDAAARRATELDAITGSVIRAARRSAVAVPELERLLAEAFGRT